MTLSEDLRMLAEVRRENGGSKIGKTIKPLVLGGLSVAVLAVEVFREEFKKRRNPPSR